MNPLIFTALLLASVATLNAADAPAAAPRNMLLIITDQQTVAALSCAGNPYVKTPHLDRLAARGVRFEKSYCTYPLCCPSRGSLFTSRTPHELAIYTNADCDLSEKGLQGKTMGEMFQAAGYETAYAGKWHLTHPFPSFKGIQIPGFTVLTIAGKHPHDHANVGIGLTRRPQHCRCGHHVPSPTPPETVPTRRLFTEPARHLLARLRRLAVAVAG
jgi:hypothetical protein